MNEVISFDRVAADLTVEGTSEGEGYIMPPRRGGGGHQVSNYDLALLIGKLAESSEQSKDQRTAMQLVLNEVAQRQAILSVNLEALTDPNNGEIGKHEKRLVLLEKKQQDIDNARQRGVGILIGVGLAAGFVGASFSDGIAKAIARVIALIK